MKVLLIDVDSKIPNLALMKIASYHKSVGDEVGFDVSDPDKVYASVIFRKNCHAIDGLKFFYPGAEINVRNDVMFYVYCHDDGQIPDAVERCNILKENGVTAYAMINRDNPTKKMIALSRWTRPWVFWSCSFNDFIKRG